MAEDRSPTEVEYPKEQQNPPQEPGLRPGDQMEPHERVPRGWTQDQPDPRRSLEEGEQGLPLSQLDRELPVQLESAKDDPETPASEDMLR